MNIEKFKPAIVYTIYIASTPEKVWQALTTAEFSRKYFFGFAVEADLKVGGAFIVRTPDGSVHISGEVIECDPPKRLTVTLNVNWPALVEKLGPTLVTYEIEPAGEAVKLTHAAIARPRHQRRHPLRRPPGLAGDPLQPQERAGDRKAARDQDGAAAADAGRAEGDGDRDAVVIASILRRLGERPRRHHSADVVVRRQESVMIAAAIPGRQRIWRHQTHASLALIAIAEQICRVASRDSTYEAI